MLNIICISRLGNFQKSIWWKDSDWALAVYDKGRDGWLDQGLATG